MIKICSYCRKKMGEKTPLEDTRLTHGICEECNRFIHWQIDGQRIDEYCTSTEHPVIIVNQIDRIAAANQKALLMLDKGLDEVRGFLGGEAFDCVYASSSEGCGKEIHCAFCTVRNLVEHTRIRQQGSSHQRVYLDKDGSRQQMVVSSMYFDGMVKLSIHENHCV